jgi:hypothetical protein
MRVDKPLPGDLVIRCRPGMSLREQSVYVLTHWPDADTVIAGPYQSFGYALRQAGNMRTDPSIYIWRDHATGRGYAPWFTSLPDGPAPWDRRSRG